MDSAKPSKRPPPLDLVTLRRLATDTWETSIRMAVYHMAQAEKPDAELSTRDDYLPSQAAAGRRNSHVRMAEVYASIARGCQKVPGSQF